MKNIQIPCTINYEIKDGQVISQLIPKLPENFDFNLLIELLDKYKPTEVNKSDEIEALKKITDMLLIYIKKAREPKNK